MTALEEQVGELLARRVYVNEGLKPLVDMVSQDFRRILDVGCGNGANAQLLAERGHSVVGVTLSQPEASACRARGVPCVVCDVRAGMPFREKSFDAVVLSHVLEHLPEPDEVLRRILSLLRARGGVYIVIPNVLHFSQRINFILGKFRYTEIGLMDRTHLRFYDFSSARTLVEACGVVVEEHRGFGHVPLGPVRRLEGSLGSHLDRAASRRLPGLFAIHILLGGHL